MSRAFCITVLTSGASGSDFHCTHTKIKTAHPKVCCPGGERALPVIYTIIQFLCIHSFLHDQVNIKMHMQVCEAF